MSQRFRADGDIFENAPRVDADLFLNGYKQIRFQNYLDACGRSLKVLPSNILVKFVGIGARKNLTETSIEFF